MEATSTVSHKECVLCGRDISDSVRLGAVFIGICTQKSTKLLSFVMFAMCKEHFEGYMEKKLDSIKSGTEVTKCLMCGVGEADALLRVTVVSDKYKADAAFGLCTECWSQWTKYMSNSSPEELGIENCKVLKQKHTKTTLMMKVYKYLTVIFLRVSLFFHEKYVYRCGNDIAAAMEIMEELDKFLVKEDE